MCCPYRVGLWQNNSDKTNQRLNPSFCRGRHFIWHNDCERYGSAENRNVPSGRAGWICVPKSEISVFNIDSDSEITFGLENAGVEPKKIKERYEATVSALKIQSLLGRNIFPCLAEKTKSCVCLCICHEPVHFVLDEPTANLDADAIDTLRQQIIQIKRRTDGCYCRTPPIFPDGSD